jgi:hypothetical protein
MWYAQMYIHGIMPSSLFYHGQLSHWACQPTKIREKNPEKQDIFSIKEDIFSIHEYLFSIGDDLFSKIDDLFSA